MWCIRSLGPRGTSRQIDLLRPYALQHRGQEAAGIAVADGSQVLVFKDLGLVSQVFDEQTLAAMEGHVAVGHCRYSTSGVCISPGTTVLQRIPALAWVTATDFDKPITPALLAV